MLTLSKLTVAQCLSHSVDSSIHGTYWSLGFLVDFVIPQHFFSMVCHVLDQFIVIRKSVQLHISPSNGCSCQRWHCHEPGPANMPRDLK